MNVKVAETAGFCFGVQRAVDRVYELIGSDAAPFIHWARSSIMRRLSQISKKKVCL